MDNTNIQSSMNKLISTSFMKSIRKVILLLVVVITAATVSKAQNDPYGYGQQQPNNTNNEGSNGGGGANQNTGNSTNGDPTNGNNPGNPDQNVPVDGGISLLIAAGVIYGMKRNYKVREEMKKQTVLYRDNSHA